MKLSLIHKDAPKEALEFFIKYVAFICLIVILIDPLQELSYLPAHTFMPTGFFIKPLSQATINVMLSVPFLLALKMLIIISAVGVFFKNLRLIGLIFLGLSFTVYLAIVRGFGHLNHSELPLLYAVYLLAAFAIADKFSPNKEINANGLPMISLGFIMCFLYVLVSIYRLAEGGIGLYGIDDMPKWIIENTNKARLFSFNLDQFLYANPWLRPIMQWGFIFVTIFEFISPLALFWRPYRICFLIIMIPFHILSCFFISIFFWEELLLYIVFFEWYKK